MASGNISPKIGLEGEKEFKNAIKEINSSLKTLDTEMKLVSSEFVGQEKSMEALTKQNDVYERKVAELNEKLELQAKQLEKAKEEYKDSPEYIAKLEQEMNKTKTQINQYNAKISENNKLMQEQSKLSNVAGVAIKGLGVAFAAAATAMAAAGAAAVVIVKAFGKMALEAGRAADELTTMSLQTGLSVDELQRYKYAADQIDVSVDTITGSMTKLTRNMSSARKGTGAAADAFKKLGVEIVDSNGELRDRNEVFRDSIKALGQIENATERDAAAMELFGKSAQELNPLILGGADALEEFGKEAQNAGLILSQGQLGNLNALNDSVDRLKATWESAKMLFAATFSGEMANTVNIITDAIQRLTKAFSEEGLEGVMRELPSIIEEVAGSLSEKAVLFAEVGGEVITALAKGLAELLPILIPVAIDAITTLAEALVEPDNLSKILSAAATAIVTLAKGIIANFPQIFNAGIDAIGELVSGLLEAVGGSVFSNSSVETVSKFIHGLRDRFTYLFTVGAEIIGKVKEGIFSVIDKATSWGSDLISGFISGMQLMFTPLRIACEGIASLVHKFLGFSVPEEGPLSDADTYGKDFMQLYADGITRNAYRVQRAVAGVAESMQPTAPDIYGMRTGASALADMKIYLSTGQLVGGIAPAMNRALGYTYTQDLRGSMR